MLIAQVTRPLMEPPWYSSPWTLTFGLLLAILIMLALIYRRLKR